jgi:SAM-dependent methyltransferase
VTAGTRLLDAGCGAGLLALLAHLRGAQVTALETAPTLLAIVRERVPAADVREGDLEAVPFADGGFDAVTAVNSIFYAADTAAAARELARVVRFGGRVVITAWGPLRAERSHDRFVFGGGSLMPPPPPGKPAKRRRGRSRVSFCVPERISREDMPEAEAGTRLDGWRAQFALAM